MTLILAMSGRSQAGKTHISNWVTSLYMQRAGIISYSFVDDDGDLWIPVNMDGKIEDKCVKLKRETLWLKENVYPYVKQYSFADTLKKFCIQHFDCTYEMMYGTNEQKNVPTNLVWGGFPAEVRKIFGKKSNEVVIARELLQAFGTNVVRKLYAPAWINGCLNQIKEDESEVAIIDDARFPDEVEAVQTAGGVVVRLTRNPINSDHESEVALDNYPHENYSAVIDNIALTRGEQNKAIFEILSEFGWVDFEIGDFISSKEEKERAKRINKDCVRIK